MKDYDYENFFVEVESNHRQMRELINKLIKDYNLNFEEIIDKAKEYIQTTKLKATPFCIRVSLDMLIQNPKLIKLKIPKNELYSYKKEIDEEAKKMIFKIGECFLYLTEYNSQCARSYLGKN